MIQAGLQGHTAPTPEDTTPNKLDKQRITIGRSLQRRPRNYSRPLCEGLGLISAGLYRETCADGNQWSHGRWAAGIQRVAWLHHAQGAEPQTRLTQAVQGRICEE